MVEEFRNRILSLEVKKEEDNILYQFQLTMVSLQKSHQQYFDPRRFCMAYKDFEGNPVNVLEQMDVDEFFNTFMDKLENQLGEHKRIINDCFGGVLSHEVICKEYSHKSIRHEPCISMSI